MRGIYLRSIGAFVALTTISLLTPASAAPINFVFEADVSGTIDAQPFNSRIRFDLTSDTLGADTFSNEFTNGYRMFVYSAQTTVTIDGYGTGDLLMGHFLISNPNPYCECVSIITADSQDLFGIWDTGLDLNNPYDFTTSLAPVSGSDLSFYSPINTSLGSIVLTGYMGGGNSLFSATLVPIPAAVWLFGSALGLLGWKRRKTA
jgi:hypothetical protein